MSDLGGSHRLVPGDQLTVAGSHSGRLLRRVVLLRWAPPEIVEQVAAALRPLDVRAGELITREGQASDRFYLVESGIVKLTASFNGQERELARLGPGEFFGEDALLGQQQLTTTARTETDVRLLTLTTSDFRALVAQLPDLETAVRQASHERQTRQLGAAFEVEHRNIGALLEKRNEIRIGRSPDNDLVFDSPTVSRHHAVIKVENGRVRLTDFGSTSGTFVNGTQVRGTVDVTEGDEIAVADQRFLFYRKEAIQLVQPQGVRIDVVSVRKEVGDGKNLLQDVSLSILPGEMVAIVGGSGAGKSTLMDAMSGVRPATHGQVLYNGRDYYSEIDQYRHTLGYVPQDDIIHREMPLRLTLRYAAKLRLPRDTSPEAIEQSVDQALDELGLREREDVRVGTLSGGQRKRASIGIELLTQPRVFFLDEPTSGLDPATDAQLMRLLRQIANDGRTVVLTTHATKNVKLCDKIVVLAKNGYLSFFGEPEEALRYFGVKDFDEVYDRLEEGEPHQWGERFRASPDYQATGQMGQPGAARPFEQQAAVSAGPVAHGLGHQLHQFNVLSRRNFDLYARFPQNFIPLVMQPVVFTLLLLILFKSNTFDPQSGNPNLAMQLVYLFSFMVFLFGLLFGVQEIVKEQAIFRRERLVNVGIVPYVLSKLSFLAPLLFVCCAGMTLILRLTGRLPDFGVETFFQYTFTQALTAWGGLTLALLTSAMVSNSQQATDLLTPWIAPQVLFAGALIAVPDMSLPGKVLAALTDVRWSFEAGAQVLDVKEFFGQSRSPIAESLLIQYVDSFNESIGFYWVILAVFVLVPLVIAAVVLRKKTQPK